jgi:hypothetical protein
MGRTIGLTPASVKDDWGRRAIVEHESASQTAELLVLLLGINASADACRACHRIVGDEINHSELSLDVLEVAGGSRDATAALRDRPPPLTTELGAPPLFRALAVAASLFCCGETVAVPLFKAMHGAARRKPAKDALAAILKDEGRHRAFGWSLLDELLGRAGDAGKSFLGDRVEQYIDATRRAYQGPERALAPKESAWGLITASAYAAAVDDAVARVIRPGFASRGLLR